MSFVFKGSELRLARVFHAMSLEDLADRVGKTRQYLHKLETDQTDPTPQLASQLAAELNVLPSFFAGQESVAVTEDKFHFRKLSTTRATIKQVAMAKAEIFGRLVCLLDRELKLPDVHIPEVEDARNADDIEKAAELCRKEWGLGEGPIANMTRVVENAGAVVTTFRSISKDIDATSVSLWRPIIVRNDAKESICRQRFDIAHEMGHFVLHQGRVTGDRLTESEANRFASAFLVPRAMMMKLFPRLRGSRLDWRAISEFKLIWKVSKAALLYRANQLGLLDDAQYRTGIITLKRTGEAIREREDYAIEPEPPELLGTALAVLNEKRGISFSDLAQRLNVRAQFLNGVLSAPDNEGNAVPGSNVVPFRRLQ